jgi:hypothetical protein
MMFAFAGTIATWIDDDWNLVERVIGFSQVGRHEHTGSGSARVLFEAMRDVGTASKIRTFILFCSTAVLIQIPTRVLPYTR